MLLKTIRLGTSSTSLIRNKVTQRISAVANSRFPAYHHYFSTTSTMSSADKSSGDKKITGWASEDGSFKRQSSSFRDVIEKGGKFEPEKGELDCLFDQLDYS
jgi:hypothetical protein